MNITDKYDLKDFYYDDNGVLVLRLVAKGTNPPADAPVTRVDLQLLKDGKPINSYGFIDAE
jgi:hypothetical protein